MPTTNKPQPHTDHTLMAFLRHRIETLPITRTIQEGHVKEMINKEDVLSWVDDCLTHAGRYPS